MDKRLAQNVWTRISGMFAALALLVTQFSQDFRLGLDRLNHFDLGRRQLIELVRNRINSSFEVNAPIGVIVSLLFRICSLHPFLCVDQGAAVFGQLRLKSGLTIQIWKGQRLQFRSLYLGNNSAFTLV